MFLCVKSVNLLCSVVNASTNVIFLGLTCAVFATAYFWHFNFWLSMFTSLYISLAVHRQSTLSEQAIFCKEWKTRILTVLAAAFGYGSGVTMADSICSSAVHASVGVLRTSSGSLIIAVVATFSWGITSRTAERFLTCHCTLSSCFRRIFVEFFLVLFLATLQNNTHRVNTVAYLLW